MVFFLAFRFCRQHHPHQKAWEIPIRPNRTLTMPHLSSNYPFCVRQNNSKTPERCQELKKSRMSLLFFMKVLLAVGAPTSAFQISNHDRMSSQSQSQSKLFSAVPSSPFGAPTAAGGLMNIDESTPRDFGTLEEWAASYGVQRSDGFQFTSHQDGLDLNVGVMTTQDIPAGQPILFVPNNLVLTGNKARQELGVVSEVEEDAIVGPMDDTLPQFYIFLKILKEYEMGDQSPWYPWLKSLPRYFPNGSSMTEFCTDLLPPLVGSLVEKDQKRYRQFYFGLKYVNFLNEDTKRNKALAKWAFAVVCTRSFPTGDGDYQITPMGDMLNHGTEAEVGIQFDQEGNFYAIANYDIPAGSPLRMLYGDPTNPSFLFARYGFVDESSPATFCKIMLIDPVQQLIDMGYDHSKMLFYKDTGDVSPEVWDVLLYRLLGDVDKQEQQKLYQAHMTGNYEIKQAMHQQYYSQTLKVLMKHIDDFLDDLDALSVTAQVYADSTSTPNPRVPLLEKHNEFVKRTFETVKNRLLSY